MVARVSMLHPFIQRLVKDRDGHIDNPVRPIHICEACGAAYAVPGRVAFVYRRQYADRVCENVACLASVRRPYPQGNRKPMTEGVCGHCGKSYRARRSVYCSQRCANRAAHAGVRTRRSGVHRAGVFARDGWMCWICDEAIDRSLPRNQPMSPTIDHVVPLSLGGRHELDNLRAAHMICNSRRGTKVAA